MNFKRSLHPTEKSLAFLRFFIIIIILKIIKRNSICIVDSERIILC
jgi:hypothetical protein